VYDFIGLELKPALSQIIKAIPAFEEKLFAEQIARVMTLKIKPLDSLTCKITGCTEESIVFGPLNIKLPELNMIDSFFLKYIIKSFYLYGLFM